MTFILHHVVLIRQLRDRARSDPKTGLLNIDGFGELARREIARTARHSGRQIALLLIDLDHFKKINDTHGHPAGDEVLRATAQTLSAEIRVYDVVGRYGGEEFVILLPDTTAAEAVGVADRIRRRINGLTVAIPSRSRSTTLSGFTASIGIAVYPDHGADLDQLLQAADGAMYRAKHAGRNRTALAHSAEPVTEPLSSLIV